MSGERERYSQLIANKINAIKERYKSNPTLWPAQVQVEEEHTLNEAH